MTQFASDSFTGTAGTALTDYSSAWSAQTGSPDGVLTNTNAVRSSNGVGAFMLHSANPGSADYTVSADAKCVTKAASTGVGLVARAASGVSTSYYANWYLADNLVRIFSRIGGLNSQLASVARSFSAGVTYACRFEVQGTALRAYTNNESTPTVSTTDGGITEAGNAGIRFLAAPSTDTTGAHLDNFSADTFGSGGVSHALEGSGAATASGAAALTTAIPLAGASASISTASGALTTAIPLSGSAAAVAAGNGVLTTQITLSGAALAQATAAAALAGGAAALAGEAAGAATADGTLTTGIPLAGNAQALADAVGALTVQIRLNGAAVADAVASGSLSASPSGLAGDASAISAASGLLGTQIRLVGEATATASASGALGVPILLSGAAAAVSSATGDLTLQLALEGHSLATALASGTLTAQIQLDGAALAQASALGTLSVAALVTPAARTWRVRSHNRILRIRA